MARVVQPCSSLPLWRSWCSFHGWGKGCCFPLKWCKTANAVRPSRRRHPPLPGDHSSDIPVGPLSGASPLEQQCPDGASPLLQLCLPSASSGHTGLSEGVVVSVEPPKIGGGGVGERAQLTGTITQLL